MTPLLLLLFAQSQLDTANSQINAGNTQAALATLNTLSCGDTPCIARKHSLSGTAHLYEASYDQALLHFDQARQIYTNLNDPKHTIDILNNIGSVHFFRGQYAEANTAYLTARKLVDANAAQPWHSSAHQLTTINLATLYQKLGRHRDALALHQSINTSALPPSEQAQSLSNRAVLMRRLGDPYKARLLLEQALQLNPHQDTRLGILKNLGIVLALDFNDYPAAARYFDQVRQTADAANDLRESLQSRLYRAELAFRANQPALASQLWAESLTLSTQAKAPEEQWRSLYGQARLTQSRNLAAQALQSIESLRSGIGAPTLKSDFLSDKSEVYEFTLALDFAQNDPAAAFHTIERSRALSLRESLPLPPTLLTLDQFQSRLTPNEAALVLESGKSHTYALWITSQSATLDRLPLPESVAARLVESQSWPTLSRLLFNNKTWPTSRLWIIPDGPLATIPLELLTPPQVETAYLPAGWFLTPPTTPAFALHFPWQAELTAFAAPNTPLTNPLPGDESLPPLPNAKAEIEAISSILPGRTIPLTNTLGLNTTPLLHLATHAIADPESAQSNRILLGDTYLYASQLKPASLNQVRLAILSACDTSRGPQLRGEGVQSLARAFIAAGARATIASHWKVDDRATRLFMEELYTQLRTGQPISTALQQTRLTLQNANAPARVWAAFTLQGAARDTLPRYLSWAQLLTATAALLALSAVLLARR